MTIMFFYIFLIFRHYSSYKKNAFYINELVKSLMASMKIPLSEGRISGCRPFILDLFFSGIKGACSALI